MVYLMDSQAQQMLSVGCALCLGFLGWGGMLYLVNISKKGGR